MEGEPVRRALSDLRRSLQAAVAQIRLDEARGQLSSSMAAQLREETLEMYRRTRKLVLDVYGPPGDRPRSRPAALDR